jgi:glucosamine kinase
MLLTADAGNSKTSWILADNQSIRAHVTGDGISPYLDDEQLIIEKISRAIRGLPLDEIQRVRYFGTGCLYNEMQLKIRKVLQNLISADDIDVSDDLTAAALALFGRKSGLAVISGTGSNAGLCENGVVIRRIHSLGYLLGDEGSGADIGFRFLKRLLSDTLPSEVQEDLLQKYGKKRSEILRELYSAKKPQAYAASFIPFIAGIRQNPHVRNCVLSSFEAMFEQMIIPLSGHHPEWPVALCGSVAKLFEPEIKTVANRYSIGISMIIQEPALHLTHFLMSDR